MAVVQVDGALIAVIERSYNERQLDNGSTRAAGVARSVWLAQGFNDEPVRIYADTAALASFQTLQGQPQGTPVSVLVEMSGKGGSLNLRGIAKVAK
jgi:hypothetical protein